LLPQVADVIEQSFYVDDCLVSVATSEKAIELVKQLKMALSNCGFNLTKWTSNKKEVVESVPEVDWSDVARLQILKEAAGERVLGVH